MCKKKPGRYQVQHYVIRSFILYFTDTSTWGLASKCPFRV